MIKTIKQFIEFRKFLNSCGEIDLENKQKQLLALSKDKQEVLDLQLQKLKQKLSTQMLRDDYSREFVRGATFTIAYIRALLK